MDESVSPDVGMFEFYEDEKGGFEKADTVEGVDIWPPKKTRLHKSDSGHCWQTLWKQWDVTEKSVEWLIPFEDSGRRICPENAFMQNLP